MEKEILIYYIFSTFLHNTINRWFLIISVFSKFTEGGGISDDDDDDVPRFGLFDIYESYSFNF